jgi:hypothetical protein
VADHENLPLNGLLDHRVFEEIATRAVTAFPECDAEIRPPDDEIGIADDMIAATALFRDQRHRPPIGGKVQAIPVLGDSSTRTDVRRSGRWAARG